MASTKMVESECDSSFEQKDSDHMESPNMVWNGSWAG